MMNPNELLLIAKKAALAAGELAREKFSRIRPTSIGQAGRISGITPSDLAVVMVYLEGRRPVPTA